MKKRIVRVKSMRNIIAFPGVEVRKIRKVRKPRIKRERLPDDDEDDWPVDERLAYIARMRGRCRYVPRKPKSA